jgi:hypothetical protein
VLSHSNNNSIVLEIEVCLLVMQALQILLETYAFFAITWVVIPATTQQHMQ